MRPLLSSTQRSHETTRRKSFGSTCCDFRQNTKLLEPCSVSKVPFVSLSLSPLSLCVCASIAPSLSLLLSSSVSLESSVSIWHSHNLYLFPGQCRPPLPHLRPPSAPCPPAWLWTVCRPRGVSACLRPSLAGTGASATTAAASGTSSPASGLVIGRAVLCLSPRLLRCLSYSAG